MKKKVLKIPVKRHSDRKPRGDRTRGVKEKSRNRMGGVLVLCWGWVGGGLCFWARKEAI